MSIFYCPRTGTSRGVLRFLDRFFVGKKDDDENTTTTITTSEIDDDFDVVFKRSASSRPPNARARSASAMRLSLGKGENDRFEEQKRRGGREARRGGSERERREKENNERREGASNEAGERARRGAAGGLSGRVSSSSSYTYAFLYLNVSNWKKKPQNISLDINARKEEEEMAASPSMIVRGKGGRKIGFLGLGTMGKGMASVLLDAFAMNRDDTKDALSVWESNGIESGNPEGERGVGRDVAERNGQERMRNRVRDAGRPNGVENGGRTVRGRTQRTKAERRGL